MRSTAHVAVARLALPLILAAAGEATEFPAPATLEAEARLPDPLVMADGGAVRTKGDWFNRRRPELKSLFQHYMYGNIPPKPASERFKVEATHSDFLGGKGTLRLVTISFSQPTAPRIDLMVALPRGARGRVPVFLALNFCGNQAVVKDSRVPLTRGWVYSSCAGCVDGRATEAGRGSQADDWGVEQILERGYAFATFCSSDVDSDRAEVSDGVYAWLARRARSTAPLEPHDRGTIAAWAWGFHRCVDYLLTDRAIDPRRIAVVGHSRNGKTALLAAAFDERIGLSIPHQAGCGGTAPSRGRVGESVKQINDRFPHWFNAMFKQFNEQPERLPFDQHCLVALMAPRPVLLSNAIDDQWANPSGQFDVLRAADPVYRFLAAGGLDSMQMPELNRLVSGRLGYYIRPGKHSMTRGDWQVFLGFADGHWGAPRRPSTGG